MQLSVDDLLNLVNPLPAHSFQTELVADMLTNALHRLVSPRVVGHSFAHEASPSPQAHRKNLTSVGKFIRKIDLVGDRQGTPATYGLQYGNAKILLFGRQQEPRRALKQIPLVRARNRSHKLDHVFNPMPAR